MASIVGWGLLSLMVKLSMPARRVAASASGCVAWYCWEPTRLPGALASLTLKRVWCVQDRTAALRSGLTVWGLPLTRLYDAITPVAAPAAMAGLDAISSYSGSTRGDRFDEVVARFTSLLFAR